MDERAGLMRVCRMVQQLCFAALIFTGVASTDAFAQKYLPAGSISREQLAPTRSASSFTVIPRLETPLSELYLRQDQGLVLSPQLSGQVRDFLVDGGVRVVIVAKAKEFIAALREAVGSVGGDIVAGFETRLEVVVPVAALKSLSELDGVRYIRRPIPVLPLDPGTVAAPSTIDTTAATGSSVTRGVVASRANLWHGKNITGVGVKVAVLDYFKDYTVAQSRGELPASITRYGTIDTTSSRHGTAVAEIIYDMAPGARLTFATPNSATQMAGYIVDLAKAGNRVISSSMGYYLDEPGDGTGSVSSAINTAGNTYGTLYCQAAGNQAQFHWDGNFYDPDGDGFHNFTAGANINQLGYLPAGTPIDLYLRWNDWPASNQNYDLVLVYSNGGAWQIAAVSDNIQNGTQPPTESIQIVTGVAGYWGFVIDGYYATAVRVMDIMGHNAPSFQFNRPDRSLVDPATPLRSFSVAAVDAVTFIRKSYSSVGPTHGPGGTLYGGRSKPRIAGYANVDTWAYGPGVFNGTSAATPHVSGAAALVWYAFPYYSPDQVMQFLEDHALDRGAAGYDLYYGAGVLNLGPAPDIRRGLSFLQLLLKK